MNKNKKQDIIEIFVKKMMNIKLNENEEKLYNNLDLEEKKIIMDLIKSDSFLYEIVNLIEKIINDKDEYSNNNTSNIIFEDIDSKKR